MKNEELSSVERLAKDLSLLSPAEHPQAGVGARRLAPLLTFGKYRGRRVSDVPMQYVLWLLSQEWFATKHPRAYRVLRDRAVQYYEREVEAEEIVGAGEAYS